MKTHLLLNVFVLAPRTGPWALSFGKPRFPLLALWASGWNGGLLKRSAQGLSLYLQIVELMSTLRFELVVFLRGLYKQTENRRVEPFSKEIIYFQLRKAQRSLFV